MLFDNRELSCCAFFPFGENKHASLQYLLDDNMLLIGFSDAGRMPKDLDWKFVKDELRSMNAVAIASIAYLNKEKILYVDSFESSLENWNKIYSKNVDFIFDSIAKAARSVGASAVIFNTQPNNATPRKFLEKASTETLKSMIRNDEIAFAARDSAVYLEGKAMLDKVDGMVHYLMPITHLRRS